MMPVSIVIPSYKGIDLLKECLPSILNFIGLNSGHEIIVVDDGSKDNTLLFLKEHCPQVKIVNLEENRGFPRASMEGILRARNRIVALINNDIVVNDDFLSPLLSSFMEDDVFAVGPKVLKRQDGVHYHLRSKAVFKKGEIYIARDQKERGEAFYASGGMIVFDKWKFLGLGGFDDLYHPFYWEDVDICYRALKKGYKILYEPDSTIYHGGQRTIVFAKKGRLELFFAKMYARIIQERNQYLFIWKNILDDGLILRHVLWIPVHLILSFGNKDQIFKPIGFLFALSRLRKALKMRKKEHAKDYILTDREILEIED